MTDPVKEQLSACLDGELPEAELDLLLKQVSRDPQLGAVLGRYALIGEVLHGQGAVAAPAGFSNRVSAAIATEPALDGSGVRSPVRMPTWLRSAAGFAVAASVAATAILVLRPEPQASDAFHERIVSTSSAEPASTDSASYIVPASTTASGAYVPAARLTNYVVAHSEYTMPLGRRSVLSSVLTEEESSVLPEEESGVLAEAEGDDANSPSTHSMPRQQ